MSFATNFTEGIRYSLIRKLSNGLVSDINLEIEKLRNLQRALDNQKSDFIFLFQNGFDYDEKKNIFHKEENIDFGRYPGKYLINVSIPEDYPREPPFIQFKPLFNKNGDNVSPHIMDDKQVCVAKKQDHNPDSYWSSTMNVKGALMLSYQVVTGELDKPIKKKMEKPRGSVPIKGTIFYDLSKLMSEKDFVRKFKLEGIDHTYSWNEIAYIVAKKPISTKKKLVEFYGRQKRRGKR